LTPRQLKTTRECFREWRPPSSVQVPNPEQSAKAVESRVSFFFQLSQADNKESKHRTPPAHFDQTN
jgi:hypothetical protein